MKQTLISILLLFGILLLGLARCSLTQEQKSIMALLFVIALPILIFIILKKGNERSEQ